MVQVIDRLEDGPIKDWYTKNKDPSLLHKIVARAEEDGYKLDTKAGILLRPTFPELLCNTLGHTSIDIILLRPTDIHYHTDVDKFIRILDGEGNVIICSNPDNNFIPINLNAGQSYILPLNMLHAFRPEPNSFLEFHLECNGMLNPEKEIQVTPFDKVDWNSYLKTVV